MRSFSEGAVELKTQSYFARWRLQQAAYVLVISCDVFSAVFDSL